MPKKQKIHCKKIQEFKESVLSPDLCCGCGACVGVCPTGALSIDIQKSHEPVLDENKCTGCGHCLAVCPGQGYPVVEWAKQRCEKDTAMLPERGPVRNYLIGHSKDPNIRSGAATGGIATSLLLHLLDKDQVDDVVVVGMENERPVAKLTHNRQNILDAMMSKYGPVPVLSKVIPELLKKPRRIAMVSTPCQLGGWLRACEQFPKLRENKVFKIGLFCGQIQSYDALSAIASTLGLEYPGDAKFVAWRYGDYPGSTRFEKADGSAVEKPLYPWLDVAVPFFSLNRCNLCPDGSNWLSDITLGDNHRGLTPETLIVCRSRRGEEMLENAKNAEAITYRELEPERVQDDPVLRGLIQYKLYPNVARHRWLRKKGMKAPQFDFDEEYILSRKSRMLRPFWILKYRLINFAKSGWRIRFLKKHPKLMEKTGHFLYIFPASVPGWATVCKVRRFLLAKF